MPKISFLACLKVPRKVDWVGVGGVVLPITLSLPTRVEVEWGCDNMSRYSRVESCVCKAMAATMAC